jgi:hypothetical protein
MYGTVVEQSTCDHTLEGSSLATDNNKKNNIYQEWDQTYPIILPS